MVHDLLDGHRIGSHDGDSDLTEQREAHQALVESERLVAIRSVSADSNARARIGPGVSHANYLDIARGSRMESQNHLSTALIGVTSPPPNATK